MASTQLGDQLAGLVSKAQDQQPALLNVVAKTSSSTQIQTLACQAYLRVEEVEGEAVVEVEVEEFLGEGSEQRD